MVGPCAGRDLRGSRRGLRETPRRRSRERQPVASLGVDLRGDRPLATGADLLRRPAVPRAGSPAERCQRRSGSGRLQGTLPLLRGALGGARPEGAGSDPDRAVPASGRACARRRHPPQGKARRQYDRELLPGATATCAVSSTRPLRPSSRPSRPLPPRIVRCFSPSCPFFAGSGTPPSPRLTSTKRTNSARCAAGEPAADFWITDKAACERRLGDVVADEERNTRDALDVVDADVRLDFYYHPFVAVSHTRDMLHEKLRRLENDRQKLPTSRN